MFATRKKISVTLGALFLAGGATAAALNHSHGTAAPAVAPAEDVGVAAVVSRSITDWQSYSGRVEAVDKVEVRPQVPGAIVAVHIKDGALVKKGDALFTIDPRPYKAEVDRALAQLAAAQARAGYAASDAARAERLLAGDAIAKRDYDQAQNAAREASANLKAAKAALETAQINLAYTNVAAPVSGRVSRAELTVGNVVSTGASAPLLTTVVSVSPIYASFNVDEQTYLNFLSRDAGGTVPVSLGLANEEGYSREGTVVSVDNQLDTATGTIRVRARFDNADGALVPGLYARVRVGGGQAHAAVMVDDAAIGTDQAKKYVLVVGNEGVVAYREVVLGPLHDGLRVISAGLQPGERIVVDGIQRARPNDHINAHDVDMVQVARATQPSA